jgi:hypothetical protein
MFNDLQHLYEAMRPLKRLSRTSAMLYKLMYDWKLDSLRSDGQWERSELQLGSWHMGWLHSLDTSRDPAAWRKAQVSLQMLQYSQGVKLHHPCFLASCSRLHIYEPWTSRFMSFPHGPLPFWQWSETSRPRQILPTLELYGIVTYCHIQIARHCKTLSVWIRHAELLPSLSQRTIPKNTAMQLCTHLLLPKNPGIKHPYSVLKCPVSYSCLGAPNSRGVIATLVACTVGLQRLHWKATMLKPPPGICENKLPAWAPSVEWPWSAYSQCANYSHYAQKKRKNASLLQQVISLQ